MRSSVDFSVINTFIFDIDGTLTDGRVAYLDDGQVIKFFNHHDMHWMKMALRAGLKVGVISGCDDQANRHLVRLLNLSFAYLGATDKIAAFEELVEKEQLDVRQCLYLGDDVVDLPVIRRAGIGVAVADAVDELDDFADFRTRASGGNGAVKEVIVRVLKAKDLYNMAMERYRR